jgi:hypothetical protein
VGQGCRRWWKGWDTCVWIRSWSMSDWRNISAGGAPFYVLGLLVTDVAPRYDRITAAMGGAIGAHAAADLLWLGSFLDSGFAYCELWFEGDWPGSPRQTEPPLREV